MKLNLNQITVSVKNVEKSVDFYQKLGLRLIVKSLPKYARFECVSGETTFSLHQSDEKIDGSTWIYFETNTLDKDVEKLIALGIEIETGGHVFHLNLTNSAGIIYNDFIPYTFDSWLNKGFKLGFTISRNFVVAKSK